MKSSLLMLVCIYSQVSVSQVTQEWVRTHNGPANNVDRAFSMINDNSGNVYLAGVLRNLTGGNDCCVAKYDSEGNLLWIRTYNGAGNGDDALNSISIDSKGNIVASGIVTNSTTKYVILKYTSEGLLIWANSYFLSSTEFYYATKLVLDDQDNIYVTGYGHTLLNGYDFLTIKCNGSGNQIWVRTYNGTLNSDDKAFDMAIDSQNNIYVVGVSNYIGGSASGDIRIIKYDSVGNLLWTKNYDGPLSFQDWANAVNISLNNNIYVGGLVNFTLNNFNRDFILLKYNNSGTLLWAKEYNSPANDEEEILAMANDSNDNCIITGYSYNSNSKRDFCTIKYNSLGDIVWISNYNGTSDSNDVPYSVTTDGQRNVYVCGYSSESGSKTNVTTIKYDSAGNQQWIMTYNGSANDDDAGRKCLFYNNNVFVCGYSKGIGTNDDITLIKYSQTVGINLISENMPENFHLFQNYPNPFNSSTKIKFSIQRYTPVDISIFDINGQYIDNLFRDNLNYGIYEIQWDANRFASGIYFCKISARDFVETQKMLLIK